MRTAKTDQTVRMPRLIWVFAGRTCHFVGFVMRRLKLLDTSSYDTLLRTIRVIVFRYICVCLIHNINQNAIWAPSSEFVSSSIPSWQILTAHAQPFRGARDLAFCLKVPLHTLLVWASSGGSGETARMRRLAWTFAARIGDKYQIRLTRSIWYCWSWPMVSSMHQPPF